MKRVLSGGFLLLFSGLVDLGAMVAGSNMAAYVNGWDSAVGRLWTAVGEANLGLPLGLAQLALAAGLGLMIWAGVDAVKARKD